MFTAGDKNFMNKNSECDVLSFAPEDRTDILKRLKEIDFANEEIASNYEDIDWFAFDCITVLMKDDEILGDPEASITRRNGLAAGICITLPARSVVGWLVGWWVVCSSVPLRSYVFPSTVFPGP